MLSALTLLLVFQLVGEVVVRGLDLPLPGPVLGMLVLFATLVMRGGPDRELQGTSQNLLQHLSLLFVPAGTGIVVHLQRVASEWLPITLALLVSTLATLAVTALSMKLLQRRAESPGVEARRVETPRFETPGLETPGVEGPRVESPRSESPRSEGPR